MKNKIFILAFTFLAAITACDIVELPLEKPEPEVIDTTEVDTNHVDTLKGVDANGYPLIDTTAMNRTTQKVLVEEFTGHSCTGCPFQTEKLLQLQEDNYPEVVVISYHEGIFAKVEEPDYPTDFTTEYGGEVHDNVYSDIQAYPAAMVNRKTFADFGNKYIFQAHNEWQGPIVASINTPDPLVSMAVGAVLNSDSTAAKIRVSMEVLQPITNEQRLVVLCIEDSVIAEQKDGRLDDSEYPKKINPNYAHRHVLRDQVNASAGAIGEAVITSSGADAGTWIDWTQEYYFSANVVNASKCYIMAFLIDSETTEVIQVEEVHVATIE